MNMYGKKGTIGIGHIIFVTFFIVLILFPIFSFVMDKKIAMVIATDIKESLDMSIIGAYNGVNNNNLGKKTVDINNKNLEEEFLKLFCENMKLNIDLTPKEGSSLEYPIIINELIYYGKDKIGSLCPCGSEIRRPMVHVNITFSINPTLYRRMINRISGEDKFSITIGYDIELPYDK